MNAARSQLKQAMEKAGARRQAALVKTVNALPNTNACDGVLDPALVPARH